MHSNSFLMSTLITYSSYSDAGNGDLEVSIVNDTTGAPVPIRVIDNEDNTYQVECTPQNSGSYTTNLKYGGLKVPVSKKTTVKPTVDVSKVHVEGLEPSKNLKNF